MAQNRDGRQPERLQQQLRHFNEAPARLSGEVFSADSSLRQLRLQWEAHASEGDLGDGRHRVGQGLDPRP